MTEDDYLIAIDEAEIGLEKANSALAVLDTALQVFERDFSKMSLLEVHYTKNLSTIKEGSVVALDIYASTKKQLDNCKKFIQNMLVKKQELLGKKAELQTTISSFIKSINSLKEKTQKMESKKVVHHDFRRKDSGLDKKR